MNIKKKIPRLVSALLSFTMAFCNVLPVYAADTIISESSIEETEQPDAMAVNEIDGEAADDGIEVQADAESRYETVEVDYSQSSSYFVTIPKTIVLGTDKKSPYSIKVEGDIVANKQVCVVPVDGIKDTEVFDFYMADQITGSTKADVVAEVSQSKFYWNHEETAAGYEEINNYIVADGLSAGKWKGTFQLEISMRTDPTHIHNYVGEVTKEPTCTESGEKTYICDCGDSYTETLDPTGHHYEKGECTICGEKDPDHKHSYTEVVTKQPTCTEAGEKTYTCDCGDSYTETIPATGHHYVDGECEHCGEKDPDAHTHSYTETITKQPTCTEDGEKTYTCECGDSYTEAIPATGHHYGNDDKCTDCGELNPEHKHNYTEAITKEPTCTEDGEKTYTCICGDNYTEVIPATGHNFVDGTCTNCGAEDPYVIAPASAYSDWNYTLDNVNNIITLNYYKGSSTNIAVYANYRIGEKTYKTKIASLGDNNTTNQKYMFANNTTVDTITFSDGIDTSTCTNMSFMFYKCISLKKLSIRGFNTRNVTDMSWMFYNCQSLTSLDVSNFDTSNVTNMSAMFNACYSLKSIDISNFDTSNVTDMSSMFANCKLLTSLDVSSFNTSNVTNMSNIFLNCQELEVLDLHNFNTTNVTNMSYMFQNCSSLDNLDLSSFNTNKVTNMTSMFRSCVNLKTIYATNGKWTTSKANKTNMFNNCGTSSVTYK